MITHLLLIWSLAANGSGTVTVQPFTDEAACRAAATALYGECHAAPGGEISDTSNVARTLQANRCTMVAADKRVAIWECKGRE